MRSFNAPVSRAILPLLVPEEHFHSAFAWGATIFQTATILGPAAGGLIYAIFRGPAAVYAAAMITAAAAAVSMLRVKPRFRARPREAFSWKVVLAGLRYIWREKLVLGSISLDLFAMLLGGAVALLPAYRERHPEDRSVGAWVTALRACDRRDGNGAAAGLPADAKPHRREDAVVRRRIRSVHDSLRHLAQHSCCRMTALVLVGATDMVSVVVRGILIQLATPDEMRGRVNAVDMIFIGSSNELGALRIRRDAPRGSARCPPSSSAASARSS